MSFQEYIKNKRKFLNNLKPIFTNKFVMTINGTGEFQKTQTYKDLETIFRERLTSVSINNIEFILQNIPLFNEYNINTYNYSLFQTSGELTFNFIEANTYLVTKTIKQLMSTYHGGLNLDQHVGSILKDNNFNLILTLYNISNQEVLQFSFHNVYFIDLQSLNFSYGDKELLNVQSKQKYLYFTITLK